MESERFGEIRLRILGCPKLKVSTRTGYQGPTISDQCGPSVIPGLVELFVNVDFRDQVAVCRVDQVSQDTSMSDGKLADLVDHALVGFRAPL